MKRYVAVESICPFIGKPCIKDGWQWNSSVIHPCAFWDGDRSINGGVSPEPPCRLQRAISRILSDEKPDQTDGASPDVPWDISKKE